jgi:tetratricopeptide (TPR) repeat protein
VVRNKGIGHTLVPELRDFYESWLEFSAEDQTGREVYHSGARQKDNSVDPLARSYTLQIVSNQGASLQHHEVWKTYVKAYDATISPGKSDVVRYRFRVPDGATRLTLSAAVRYRRFRRSFTDWVFDDRPDAPDRFPTVTMAAGRFDLKVGENQPSPSPTLPPDLTTTLRWNNYGIGMLERQQTAVATQAFRQVVAVDPAYQPGYVNVAIAEYTSGNYTEAEKWLAQALAKDPKDPRALYYRGLCERWQNHYDQAIATLQPVADQYPRVRQIHQELGYLDMTVRKFSEAKTEYQRVLDIDPDDPVTHRWLGPVLAALGDSAGAQREAVLAAQTGNDTAAGWVAQRFWREHQVIASESMPAHTFTQTGLPDDADAKRLLNLQNPPSYIWIEHY